MKNDKTNFFYEKQQKMPRKVYVDLELTFFTMYSPQ